LFKNVQDIPTITTDQMPCACEKKGKKASKQTQHVCSAKEEEEVEEEEEQRTFICSRTDSTKPQGS
jgi:hypothetical protein